MRLISGLKLLPAFLQKANAYWSAPKKRIAPRLDSTRRWQQPNQLLEEVGFSRLEYIEREIAVLEHRTKLLDDAPLMESKLEVLKRVRQEIKPKKFTENQLTIRDATKVNRTLPISGEGTEYKQYHVGGGNRVLRIGPMHPDLPESRVVP